MPILNWTPEFSVGVNEFDEQHQQLMAIMNKLFTLYTEKKFSSTDVGPIFKELNDYADMHFSTEEHYFDVYNYPKKAEHTAMHDAHRRKVRRIGHPMSEVSAWPHQPEEFASCAGCPGAMRRLLRRAPH